jgi:hypothetical protein
MEMSISIRNLEKSQLVKVQIVGWKNPIKGIFISQGSEWILMQSNPVDYQIDGFLLIFKKYISNIGRGNKEIFCNNVILACDKIRTSKLDTDTNSTIELIRRIKNSYGIVSIQSESEVSIDVGIIEDVTDYKVFFNHINSNGIIMKSESVELSAVRLIEFDTDYLTSLLTYNRKYIHQNVQEVRER